ncbi:MAG TPA: nitrogen regulation protein, partial [Legionella sp.]|nr:nitrogen regulation protein [Legionella sp.]
MQAFLNSPFHIGGLRLSNRLIQGPLAGFSCAPFRQLFYQYTPPAYCVSEMISAHDVLDKHQPDSRYLYRAPEERVLCYQLSGNDPFILAQAADRVQALGADLIDLNAGCPKPKIRKKGAGSALLDEPQRLFEILRAVRQSITIPLTVKLRIAGDERDVSIAQGLEQAGADALTVHGRRWTDDYDIACDFSYIARIKQAVRIPVIANGDIADHATLAQAIANTGCDAYMIARAGSGHPWLYQQLLAESDTVLYRGHVERVACFMQHLHGLAGLESEHQAVLQSKSLVRYYFKRVLNER